MLPFPPTSNTLCSISLYGELLPDNTYDIIRVITPKVTFEEKSSNRYLADGEFISLHGRIFIQGDIVPDIAKPQGTVDIAGLKYNIYAWQRHRQPDGKIHHTEVTLE